MHGSGTARAAAVSFTTMAAGTREDYELLARFEEEFAAGLADRVLAQLRALAGSLAGYQVDRLGALAADRHAGVPGRRPTRSWWWRRCCTTSTTCSPRTATASCPP